MRIYEFGQVIAMSATKVMVRDEWGWALGSGDSGEVSDMVIRNPACTSWWKRSLTEPAKSITLGGWRLPAAVVILYGAAMFLWLLVISRMPNVPWHLAAVVIGALAAWAHWWIHAFRARSLRVVAGEHARHLAELSRSADQATLWRAAADPALALSLAATSAEQETYDETPSTSSHYERYPHHLEKEHDR